MPAPKPIPAPVLAAHAAMDVLRAQDPAIAAALETKKLPKDFTPGDSATQRKKAAKPFNLLCAFAMKLEKSGAEVTTQVLLAHARQGAAHIRAFQFAPEQQKTPEDRYDAILSRLQDNYAPPPRTVPLHPVMKGLGYSIAMPYDDVALFKRSCAHLIAQGTFPGGTWKGYAPPEYYTIKTFEDFRPLMLDIGMGGNTYLDILKYLHAEGLDLKEKCGNLNLAPEISAFIMSHGGKWSESADNPDPRWQRVTNQRREAYAAYEKGRAVWQAATGEDPPAIGIHAEPPSLFRPEAFALARRGLRFEGQKDAQGAPMAFHAAALFETPDHLLSYLDRHGEKGRQPLHDLVYMIKVPQGAKNIAAWREAVLECGPAMAEFVRFADRMESPQRDNKMNAQGRYPWSVAATRAEVAKFVFNRAAEHPALAALCNRLAIDEEDFETALDVVQGRTPAHKNIPDIAIDGAAFDMPGARFYRLPPGDIRALVVGKMTNCCQNVGDNGQACAIHSYESEDGGVYVIEKNSDIVAAAWAWLGDRFDGDTLCLDSLESRKGKVSDAQWEKLVRVLAEKVVADENDVTEITLGTGGNTPEALSGVFNAVIGSKPRGYPDDGYRDSGGPGDGVHTPGHQIQVWQMQSMRTACERSGVASLPLPDGTPIGRTGRLFVRRGPG